MNFEEIRASFDYVSALLTIFKEIVEDYGPAVVDSASGIQSLLDRTLADLDKWYSDNSNT